MDELLS